MLSAGLADLQLGSDLLTTGLHHFLNTSDSLLGRREFSLCSFQLFLQRSGFGGEPGHHGLRLLHLLLSCHHRLRRRIGLTAKFLPGLHHGCDLFLFGGDCLFLPFRHSGQSICRRFDFSIGRQQCQGRTRLLECCLQNGLGLFFLCQCLLLLRHPRPPEPQGLF